MAVRDVERGGRIDSSPKAGESLWRVVLSLLSFVRCLSLSLFLVR